MTYCLVSELVSGFVAWAPLDCTLSRQVLVAVFKCRVARQLRGHCHSFRRTLLMPNARAVRRLQSIVTHTFTIADATPGRSAARCLAALEPNNNAPDCCKPQDRSELCAQRATWHGAGAHCAGQHTTNSRRERGWTTADGWATKRHRRGVGTKACRSVARRAQVWTHQRGATT